MTSIAGNRAVVRRGLSSPVAEVTREECLITGLLSTSRGEDAIQARPRTWEFTQ
jgi:hypothetical protein